MKNYIKLAIGITLISFFFYFREYSPLLTCYKFFIPFAEAFLKNLHKHGNLYYAPWLFFNVLFIIIGMILPNTKDFNTSRFFKQKGIYFFKAIVCRETFKSPLLKKLYPLFFYLSFPMLILADIFDASLNVSEGSLLFSAYTPEGYMNVDETEFYQYHAL